MNNTLDFLQLLDFKLIALIIISAYWAKRRLQDILPQITLAHKVFFLSTIISVFYYFFMVQVGVKEEGFYKLLISYFAATSLYELAFSPIERWVKNRLSKLDK